MSHLRIRRRNSNHPNHKRSWIPLHRPWQSSRGSPSKHHFVSLQIAITDWQHHNPPQPLPSGLIFRGEHLHRWPMSTRLPLNVELLHHPTKRHQCPVSALLSLLIQPGKCRRQQRCMSNRRPLYSTPAPRLVLLPAAPLSRRLLVLSRLRLHLAPRVHNRNQNHNHNHKQNLEHNQV